MNNSIVKYKLQRLTKVLAKMTDVDFALFYVLVEKERTKREINNEIAEISHVLETID